MSAQDETVFCDIHIPLQDDIVSNTFNTFLFDDESWEDSLLWEELKGRIEETSMKDSDEYNHMISCLEKSAGDMYIGGVKTHTKDNTNYINMILYTRKPREDDESHLRFVREAIVNPFNEITGRSKGNGGIFVHMADTKNRCFVVTDGEADVGVVPEMVGQGVMV